MLAAYEKTNESTQSCTCTVFDNSGFRSLLLNTYSKLKCPIQFWLKKGCTFSLYKIKDTSSQLLGL